MQERGQALLRIVEYVPLAPLARSVPVDHKAEERRLMELSFLRNLLHQAEVWLRHDAGRELVLRSTGQGIVVEVRPLGAEVAAEATAAELAPALGAALEEQIGLEFRALLARKHDADRHSDGGA